jgi:hypothetical protein
MCGVSKHRSSSSIEAWCVSDVLVCSYVLVHCWGMGWGLFVSWMCSDPLAGTGVV